MNFFINSNPGLQSRFIQTIHFDDYLPGELLDIFKVLCTYHQYDLDLSAEDELLQIFSNRYNNRSENFGNGRFVRNFFEITIKNQAKRIKQLSLIEKSNSINQIKIDDVIAANSLS
jgi:hypothetical protein